MQGIILFPGVALPGHGLLEGLTLHNERSLEVHFHILGAIRQYYLCNQFKIF